jgi:hypothetical protein
LTNNQQSPEVENSSESSEINESSNSLELPSQEKSIDNHESFVGIPIQSELEPSVFEIVLKELQEASPAQPRHNQLFETDSNISFFFSTNI